MLVLIGFRRLEERTPLSYPSTDKFERHNCLFMYLRASVLSFEM